MANLEKLLRKERKLLARIDAERIHLDHGALIGTDFEAPANDLRRERVKQWRGRLDRVQAKIRDARQVKAGDSDGKF